MIVYEQFGRAVRAARLLAWTESDEVPAGEARGGGVYQELSEALTLAAAEALLASARLRQLDELRSTDGALRTEAAEVAEPSPRTTTCPKGDSSRLTGSCTRSSGPLRRASRSGSAVAREPRRADPGGADPRAER